MEECQTYFPLTLIFYSKILSGHKQNNAFYKQSKGIQDRIPFLRLLTYYACNQNNIFLIHFVQIVFH